MPLAPTCSHRGCWCAGQMAQSLSTENVIHGGMVPGETTQGKGSGGRLSLRRQLAIAQDLHGANPEGWFTEIQMPSSGIFQDRKVILFLV